MRCHACRVEVALASGESVGYRDAASAVPRISMSVSIAPTTIRVPTTSAGNRVPSAILDRDRANRCDYFRPGYRHDRGNRGAQQRSQLARRAVQEGLRVGLHGPCSGAAYQPEPAGPQRCRPDVTFAERQGTSQPVVMPTRAFDRKGFELGERGPFVYRCAAQRRPCIFDSLRASCVEESQVP